MHVSRQFEKEAVREWFRHCIIDCEDLGKWAKLCKLDARIQACVVSLRCSWGRSTPDHISRIHGNRDEDFSQLRNCKQLRYLQLRVSDEVFDTIPNRFIFHDDYAPEDFEKLKAVAEFRRMPSLQSVLLIPQESGALADTPEEQEKWMDNLRSLEDFINQQIQNKTQPSPSPKPLEGEEAEIAIWTACD